jgi:zinc transport system permease protein
MNEYLTIFQYDFMVRAFIAGILIALVAPLIGIFIVVKRYSMLADTLSHVSLLGVSLGVLLNFNPVLGALLTSTTAAFGMELLRRKRALFSESVLALFLSGSLAFALVILGLAHGLNVNLFSFLFGSITTVTPADLVIVAIGGVSVVLLITLFFRQFFLVAYDEDLAQASGLKVRMLNILIIFLAAVTVSISMRIVGVLLVGALMVIPVLSATQFRLGFLKTTLTSVFISLLSVIAGLFISFYADLPSGATIVVFTIFLFIVSLLLNGKKG